MTRKKNYLKSYFFVNKSHNGYKFGDRPNANENETFLKTLLPRETAYTEESANIYSTLYLLPNLKLFELLPQQSWPDNDITFSTAANNPNEFEGTIPVLSQDLIEHYIRLILNNIFYCILRRLNVNRKERYLNITLLMPNVYAQEKVYRLVKDFYDDFKLIAKSSGTDDFSNFKGIEVQVMSESDASFFGIRFSSVGSNQTAIEAEDGGNFLIIDAGKGTTDFSILRQQADVVVYDSIFRTGLPGSGQTLTYAFMEALNDLLPTIRLDEFILSTKDIPDILWFMEIMETFKCEHDQMKDGPAIAASEKFENLRQLNVFLVKNYLDEKLRLPGSDAKLKSKIKDLVDKVEETVKLSGIEDFTQIIFAGRALKLDALHTELESRFSNKLSSTPDKHFFVYHKDTLKSVCLKGAFNKRFGRVNYNSELIGIPLIIDKNKQVVKDIDKTLGGKFFNKNKVTPNADEHILDQFFFNGRDFTWTSDLKFKIGAVDYQPEFAEGRGENCNIFYAGDSFLLRWENSTALLEGNNLPEYYTQMVKETLFPFAYLNFAKPGSANTKRFKMNKAEPQQTNADQEKAKEAEVHPSKQQAEEPVVKPLKPIEEAGGEKKKDDDKDKDILA